MTDEVAPRTLVAFVATAVATVSPRWMTPGPSRIAWGSFVITSLIITTMLWWGMYRRSTGVWLVANAFTAIYIFIGASGFLVDGPNVIDLISLIGGGLGLYLLNRPETRAWVREPGAPRPGDAS